MEPDSLTTMRFFTKSRGKGFAGRIQGLRSRQPVFAAKPDMLFRFHPRHIEQPNQHAELVASRHLRQFGCYFRNEGGGLIRAAIALRIIGSRTAIPARGCALSPAPCLGQKLLPVPCLGEKMLFLRVQL